MFWIEPTASNAACTLDVPQAFSWLFDFSTNRISDGSVDLCGMGSNINIWPSISGMLRSWRWTFGCRLCSSTTNSESPPTELHELITDTISGNQNQTSNFWKSDSGQNIESFLTCGATISGAWISIPGQVLSPELQNLQTPQDNDASSFGNDVTMSRKIALHRFLTQQHFIIFNRAGTSPMVIGIP